MFGAKLEHLDLIEYVIVDLLKVKWNSFVRRTFYTQFLIFVMFFLLSSCCFVLRETTPTEEDGANCTLSNMTTLLAGNLTTNLTDTMERSMRALGEAFLVNGTMVPEMDRSSAGQEDNMQLGDLEMNSDDATNTTELCPDTEEEGGTCFHNNYDTVQKQARLGMEIVLVVWSLLYLVKAGHERTFLGRKIWSDNMKMCPSR